MLVIQEQSCLLMEVTKSSYFLVTTSLRQLMKLRESKKMVVEYIRIAIIFLISHHKAREQCT